MIAKQKVKMARRRFRVACNGRFDATGNTVCRDIAFKVARRAGVPVRAVWPEIFTPVRSGAGPVTTGLGLGVFLTAGVV